MKFISKLRRLLPALGLLATIAWSASPLRAQHKPFTLDPASFELHPALSLTLFASEPDVVDPVALTFDEDGRLYVVEMRDYPLGIGPDHAPGGTVRLLEDTDGDGRIDRSIVFADRLSFPTSIAPWNGGVIVTAPPEIIFLKDTDGDGRADVREVLLRGFHRGVTDSNVNGLRWGLDNRVHGVNGGNGGTIFSTRHAGPAVPLRDRDFSFDPLTGDFATTWQTSGGFGLVFDDWGHSFCTYNINHIQQRILAVRYLDRCPGFPPVEGTMSISDHEDLARIYPMSTPQTRVNHPEQSGHFSAAGGLGFLNAPWITGDLRGSVLVCDVVGNLVHRDVLVERGPIFNATRSADEQRKEFFASRDSAFRPVGLELGPDGALYLLDMQRDVIEHPDYIPQKVKEKLNVRAGEDRGRIYRITPKNGLPPVKPKLRQASTKQLVATLAHANPWWRATAQRLLVERKDPAAAPQLRKLAVAQSSLGRLHALSTLAGLGMLNELLVKRSLADAEAGVRENALQLAERFLPGSPKLRAAILSRADDPSAHVRFQVALTLGQLDASERADALRRIFLRDLEHRWSRLAVMSASSNGADKLVQALLNQPSRSAASPEFALTAARELADLIGARAGQTDELDSLFRVINAGTVTEPWRVAVFDGLADGLARVAGKPPVSPSSAAALDEISRTATPTLLRSLWQVSRALGLPENQMLRRALADAIRTAGDAAKPDAERLASIRLLGLGGFSATSNTLFARLSAAESAAIQSAAIESLRPHSDPVIASVLLERWRELSPSLRPAVVNWLLSRPAWHGALLDALEHQRINPGELNLDLEQRRRLLRRSSTANQTRAAKFFGDEEYSNRKTLVNDWLPKLPANGEARHGRELFEKTCAQCHVVGILGQRVGPDLSDVSHRSVEDIASNILDPNMAINPGFIAYLVEMTDGELESGVLQSESREAVTLVQAQGKKLVVPRARIKRLESTGVSLMPEGLEAGMTPADLRDLIAFLQEPR